jgi:hypothetical protein
MDYLMNKIVVFGVIFVFGLIYFIVTTIIRFRSLPKSVPFSVEAEKYSGLPISGPESIGSISMRLGEDVRDIWGMGYSDDQINGVLTGKYTLDEMYKMGPEGNTKSSQGQEILVEKSSVK